MSLMNALVPQLSRSLYSVAGVLTSSDYFPSPCTLEVGEVVPKIPTLTSETTLAFSEKHLPLNPQL